MKTLHIVFQLGLTASMCALAYRSPTGWSYFFAGAYVAFDLLSLPRWLRD